MSQSLKQLINTVIEPDYCIGCGVCASLEDSPLEMNFTEDGMYKPIIKETYKLNELKHEFMKVCPFSNESKNETELGKELFSTHDTLFNDYNGYYIKNFAGHVKAADFRSRGASGGMANWIASKLLELKLVDAIIHVKDGNLDKGTKMYEYGISYTVDELKAGAKSKYYPIELSEVIKKVKESNELYAVIGIPCFIKSLRLLAQQDVVIKERIKFHIGLVCGHLKSSFFAESMAWELGIEPKDLEYFDFRKKDENQPANRYGVEAVGKKNGVLTKVGASTKDLYPTNWGQGFFKYNACEYCDDVLGETADITLGDAWLPEYSSGSGGTNVIVVRHPIMLEIINEHSHELELDEITAERIYASQAGGFRHRRQGLSHRLYLKEKEGQIKPQKRVSPSSNIEKSRGKIYEKRVELKDASIAEFKKAKESNDFNLFLQNMKPKVEEYNKAVKPILPLRIYNKLKRLIKE